MPASWVNACLTKARESAGGRDVRISGGADVIQQYLNMGVIEELEIAVAPVLFGGGRRLFENVPEPVPQFRVDKVLNTPDATHLRYFGRMSIASTSTSKPTRHDWLSVRTGNGSSTYSR